MMPKRPLVSVGVALLALAAASTARAQLGSRPAKDWIPRLERPDRVAGLKTAEVIDALQLKPGTTVADLGAGAGTFTWPFARAVAPGTVFAVEVDAGFIKHLENRAKEENLTNVRPVLGKYDDPLLPEPVDLAFFHDVLHHIADRPAYLKTLSKYVKPNGRIAVIDLDPTRPDASHSDQPDQQVMKEQLHGWMTALGMRKTGEFDLYENKWFVVYTKPATR